MNPDTLPLRGIWRMARVGVHLASGAATVALRYPRSDLARRLRLKQEWSRRLMGILGIESVFDGAMAQQPRLIVANHTSWVDIFAINAIAPAAFVCKDDVRGWPLIGWLCANTDSIFIRRGDRRAARDVAKEVQLALLGGRTVAVFPEGTTTEGDTVLPFRGALLQPAIDSGYPLQPVALRYRGADGEPTSRVAYCGELSFIESLWRICSTRGLTVELAALPLLETTGAQRGALAHTCRARITSRLGLAEHHAPPTSSALTPTRDLAVSTVSA
ncbi:MAG: lysophospholipid acyltransferase family protein [Rhodocyclaceae bacterium]